MPPWTGPKIFTPSSVVSGTYFTYMPISRPIQERASATATTRNAVAAGRGVTPSILPERSAQVRPPTGGDFIPHREAAGQPELLQLAHVPLERERLAPQRGGEIRRADAGTVGDQAQHVPGPRLAADGVPAVEPVVDGAAVLVTQLRLLPQGDPRIVAFEAHLHPVDPRAVPSLEQPVQLVSDRTPERTASSSVSVAGSTSSTMSMRTTPADVRCVLPGRMRGRSHRRKASVTDPSVIPAAVAGLISTSAW